MIRARIEPHIKKEAEEIFKAMGLGASEAIGLFYHQVALKKGMPFELSVSSNPVKSRLAAYSRTALVNRSREMSPDERLSAFFHQSQLTKKMEQIGQRDRQKGKGR